MNPLTADEAFWHASANVPLSDKQMLPAITAVNWRWSFDHPFIAVSFADGATVDVPASAVIARQYMRPDTDALSALFYEHYQVHAKK